MKKSPRVCTILLTVSLTLLGCSAEQLPDGMPELQPLTIEIVQGGTPLEGASVQLIPQDAANTWASGGSTDPRGQAEIMTMGKYRGAPVGTYKVTIDKFLNDGPAAAMDDPSGGTAPTSYRLVDPQFSRADTTTAEITVAKGETNQATIDIGDAVKIKLPAL
ncbi:MAG: carboxypeptidase regulatory-like domain-containing protein [Novipirellula sp. JB048]